ncbi:MAG: hypothetical protein ACE3L7_33035 [Candidatus Pristimantibacillus sp.]
MHLRQIKSTLETLTRYSKGEKVTHEVMRIVASDMLEIHNKISEDLYEQENDYDKLFHSTNLSEMKESTPAFHSNYEQLPIYEILVYFPPAGEVCLELLFFLQHEGQRFFKSYAEMYERHKDDLPLCETYEQYITNYLEPSLKKYDTIRLGVDPYDNKTTWLGLKDADQYTLNFLPQVDYDFYLGAAKYRMFSSNI